VAKRKLSNPLALAVLSLLVERPMHPYEMSSTMRERVKEASIKLNYGSLYSVVDSLVKHGLIEVHETVREGRRPERTVYAITNDGRVELVDWLSELLSVPVKEYTQFEAALSLMPCLPPDEVSRLLHMRRTRLDAEIVGAKAILAQMDAQGMPYLWSIENDYLLRLREAELKFVDELLERIDGGTLDSLALWRAAHEGGELPTAEDWKRAASNAPARLRKVE
jgi:DNA-binding PadR family transcriptional regulator